MFRGLRWRLLLSYLVVMAAILAVFGAGVFWFFSRSFYRQLDKKLLTLAQAAAPSLSDVKFQGEEYLDQVNEVPWRDIFNRDRQSLEWFNAEGQLLASKGALSLPMSPQPGPHTLRRPEESLLIRTFTISVFNDESEFGQPTLEGYIRASQSTEDVQLAQGQLLWGLGMGGAIALGLVGVGGLWLTQKALGPIETSFQQLRQFTADASHELRSPLTAIKTSVAVMLKHPERIHPKDAKKLAAIDGATTQMSHLVEDLLFLARTDAAKASMPIREWKQLPLDEVLQDLVELMEPSAQIKEIDLKFQVMGQAFIFGDEAQLKRLFSNLVNNALQYTPAGGTVTVAVMKQVRFAVVKIHDTGIGIPPEQLPFVFDRFWRADKARSRREGGIGLGLAIARAIAQQHGGRLTVRSRVGVGSCFYVRLPIV